jgi:hypothetical protein
LDLLVDWSKSAVLWREVLLDLLVDWSKSGYCGEVLLDLLVDWSKSAVLWRGTVGFTS